MTDQDNERTIINPPLSVLGHGWQPDGHVSPNVPTTDKPTAATGRPPSNVMIVGALSLAVVLGLCTGIAWAMLTGNSAHVAEQPPELANLGVTQQPTAVVATSSPPKTTTPPATGVPASGPFTATLLGYASQLCVDPVPGGAGPVQLAACGVGPEQSFTFQPVSGGYALVDSQTDQCLDAQGAQTTDGDPVIPAACDNGPDQDWILRPATGGDGQDYQLVLALDGKCLDATNEGTSVGTPLQQWDCHADPFNPANQTWRIEVSQ
jgi:hypothetical protein